MDISGKMSRRTEARLRSDMQMIFQDPMACLNPRQKVADIIAQGWISITGTIPRKSGPRWWQTSSTR